MTNSPTEKELRYEIEMGLREALHWKDLDILATDGDSRSGIERATDFVLSKISTSKEETLSSYRSRLIGEIKNLPTLNLPPQKNGKDVFISLADIKSLIDKEV